MFLLLWASLSSGRILRNGAGAGAGAGEARTGRQSGGGGGGAAIDFSGAYDDPETGLKCVDDQLTVQSKEAERLLECTHSTVNICHYTYVTK